ncbi:MAG TPA: zinc ribbon domain-containing protein [Thermoflexia bacterium]|nr:zinc ribbon domain-containing protein [Thermoflexia bacterium]
MISCPKCGVANPEDSRSCRACGTPLSGGEEAGRRCPMCGAMNPADSVVCEQCQARLVPLVAEEAAEAQPEVPSGEEVSGAEPFSEEVSLPAEEEPDWLTELRATMEEAEEEQEPPVEEAGPVAEVEVPDWLRELTPSAPPPSEEAEGEAETEVPEWLQESAPEAAPPEEEVERESEVPEWIQEVVSPEEEAEETAEVPDWLREVSPPDASVEEEEVEAAPPPEGELEPPAWLQEVSEEVGGGPFVGVPTEEAEAVQPGAEAPEWLREIAEAVEPPSTPPEREAEEEVSLPPTEEAEEPEEAELPTWLLQAVSPVEAPAEEAPTEAEEPEVRKGVRVFTSEEGVPTLEPGEVPDWLKELAPTDEVPLPVPEEKGEEEIEGLAPAEIPDWLEALRPREEGGTPEEPVETEGVLEGLRGTLPPSPAVEAAERAVSIPSVTAKPASIARAELFQELLTRPIISPRRIERRRERGVGLAIQRLIIGLLLLAAVLAPMAGMWLPVGEGGGSAAPALLPDVQAAYTTVETRVHQGTPVLVSIEYGPSEAEEVDLVAQTLLRHILDRGGRLILVSTRPEGPALADRLLSALVEAADREARVVNLGYQPGQASGVQGLLANLARRPVYPAGVPASEMPAMEGVSSAEDVNLVVVLGGQDEDVLTWIEQTSARYPDLPVVAGVSARVEVSASPYLERAGAGALKGLVVGLPGATVYQDLRGEEDRHLTYYLQSVMWGQWAVAALMAVGMVVFLAGGKGR